MAPYGKYVSGIQGFMPGSTDPNFPKVGYRYRWDTATAANGTHKVAIRAYSSDGKMRNFERRTVFLDNP